MVPFLLLLCVQISLALGSNLSDYKGLLEYSIHDISYLIDNSTNITTFLCDGRLNTLELGLLEQAEFYYIKTETDDYKHAILNASNYWDSNLLKVFPKVGFLFSTTFPCPPEGIQRWSDVAIVTILDFPQEPVNFCTFFQNKNIFKRAEFPEMKFGLELNDSIITQIFADCPARIKNFDFIIYNINLHPIIRFLSYSRFSNQMSTFSKEKLKHVKNINSNCGFYFRMNIAETSLNLTGSAQVYRKVLKEYMNYWLETEAFPQNAIVDFVANSSEHADMPLNKIKWTYVYPYLYEYLIFPNPDEILPNTEIYTPCHFMRFINTSKVNFENVLVWANYHQQRPYLEKCNTSLYKSPLAQNEFPLVSYGVRQYENETISILLEEFDGKIELMFKPKVVYFLSSTSKFVAGELDKMKNYSVSEGFNVGCSQRGDDTFLYGTRSCDPLLNSQSTPRLMLNGFGDCIVEQHDHRITAGLDRALAIRKYFLEQHPEGEVVLRLTISDRVYYSDFEQDNVFRQNLFCSPEASAIKALHEAISIWAELNQFPTLIQPLIDSRKKTGWWFNVVTERDLNRTFTDFPVLVRRNVPEQLPKQVPLPYTYPCIYATDYPSPFPILFERNNFSGTTVNLNLFNVSHDGLQTMLAFAFERFSSVELAGLLDLNWNLLCNTLNDNFYEALSPRIDDDVKLFVEFKDLYSFQVNGLQGIENCSFPPSGVHFSGWEEHANETDRTVTALLAQYRNIATSTKVSYGVTIQNCTHEINSGLVQLKSLKYFDLLNYTVCVVRPFPATNKDKEAQQKYLDTLFYIQQYFHFFLKKETYFRLALLGHNGTNASQRARRREYLKFLNDTNQYSEGYKIRMFMGEAFADSDSPLWGWWDIGGDDNANLKNDSQYKQVESEYFGMKTEQKYKIARSLPYNLSEDEDKGDKTTNSSFILTAILSTAVLILVGLVLGLWAYYRRRVQQVLSKAELNAFRHGEEIERNEKSIGAHYVKVSCIKTLGFKNEFEIRKKDIDFGEIIGQGNFGLVYRGLLVSRGKHVAIKIPNSDCPKECFKTMLSEVKILCYIGIHPNIVTFLGAHTKEIENGMIYVVTEYCDNGSLEVHLQQQQRFLRQKYGIEENAKKHDGYVFNFTLDSDVAPYQTELLRFSYEIALGMEYIAGKNVVHADLSARNVLLAGDMTCKIGDFGLSRKLYESLEYIKNGDEALPWRWMAVESLKKMEFTSKSDVWSYGVTLWEIFSFGDIPYPGVSWNPKFSKKLEGGYRMAKPEYASDNVYKMILECWQNSPDDRPTFTRLSNHFKGQMDTVKKSPTDASC